MAKDSLQTLVDKVCKGGGGLFQAPVYWVKKIMLSIIDSINQLTKQSELNIKNIADTTNALLSIQPIVQKLDTISTPWGKIVIQGRDSSGNYFSREEPFSMAPLCIIAPDTESVLIQKSELLPFHTVLPFSLAGYYNSCNKLKTIYNRDYQGYIYTSDISLLCAYCSELESARLDMISYLKNTNATMAFYNCTKLVSVTLNNSFRVADNIANMFSNCYNLSSLPFESWSHADEAFQYLTTAQNAFTSCTSIQTINFRGWKMNSLIDASGMFFNCECANTLLMDEFTGLSLLNADEMFRDCQKLQQIDLPKLVASNLQSIDGMFNNCNSAKTISIPLFKGDNVITAKNCFSTCVNLTSLQIPQFTGRSLEDAVQMFRDCNRLQKLSLPKFRPPAHCKLERLFQDCNELAELDIPSMIPIDANNAFYMFRGTNLHKIRCTQSFKDWCLSYADRMELPAAMKEGGTGVWEIVDEPETVEQAS